MSLALIHDLGLLIRHCNRIDSQKYLYANKLFERSMEIHQARFYHCEIRRKNLFAHKLPVQVINEPEIRHFVG